MNKISKFLSVPLRFINRDSKFGKRPSTEGFEVRSGSYLANYTVLSYLIQYPLFSYKYINVPVQIELLRLSMSKSYRTTEGLKFLTDQKASMDFYSTSSHWEHINKNFWNS
uniref:LAGLIDADG homing endonuclease n=1 Tax=Phanerochaete carnosa TaxID=231932 RepID=A0A895KW75_9APHY|nr:LAGLIDADG homing endonuclease [Phanerochaete carnosa]QRZ60362.1 LAGLIDADG homing endonuclease [Phanerochaete carnosa]